MANLGLQIVKDHETIESFKLLKKNTKKPFASEKEMCDFIAKNADLFAEEVLLSPLVDISREFCFPTAKLHGSCPRLDFMCYLENGEAVGVECKNPKFSYSEQTSALGQLLGYATLAKTAGIKLDRIVLVSSKYHEIIPAIIRLYKLPIELCILTREFTARLL